MNIRERENVLCRFQRVKTEFFSVRDSRTVSNMCFSVCYHNGNFGNTSFILAQVTTLVTLPPDTDTMISKLQSTSDKFFTWFKNKHMKANPEKSHLFLSSKTPTESIFVGSCIKSNTKETLLCVLIDSELRFDEYISLIC